MTAIIGTAFELSLVPAYLWFFCDHQYFDGHLHIVRLAPEDRQKVRGGLKGKACPPSGKSVEEC